MSSLRCSPCGLSWPTGKDYQPCPVCLGKTDRVTDTPMDTDEAHSKMTHARFEHWCSDNGRLDPVEQLERIPVEEKAA